MHSGHDLRLLQPSFLHGEDPNYYQDLVEDFEGDAEAVADITQANEVVNNVFFHP